jgi:hypothetical protein
MISCPPPLKNFHEIILAVSRYGEVGRKVPFKKDPPNSCRGIETLSYFKTGMVVSG